MEKKISSNYNAAYDVTLYNSIKRFSSRVREGLQKAPKGTIFFLFLCIRVIKCTVCICPGYTKTYSYIIVEELDFSWRVSS